MSLSSAILSAKASLGSVANQSAIVSRNIAGANDPAYSRKVANLVTTLDGAGEVVSVTRATNTALLDTKLAAGADNGGSQALSAGLEKLQATVGDTTDTTSPSALLNALSNALQTYAASPNTVSAGQAALSGAKALVQALNQSAQTVSAVRSDADADIATAVANVNDLLTQFKTANDAVVKGTLSGADTSDAADQRDVILNKLSAQIGISTVQRPNSGLALYTDSGATLFEATARTVTFTPSSTLAAGQSGQAVYVDACPSLALPP